MSLHLPAPVVAAIAGYHAWLDMRFGARLREFRLFGSYARGEGRADSDVDLLVAIDDLTTAEARESAQESGEALTHHDVLLAPFLVSTARMAELRQRERRIACDIDREGVPM